MTLPRSIKWFSRLFWLNLLLGFVETLINTPLDVAVLRSKPKLSWLDERTATDIIVVAAACGLFIQLSLWFYMTRRGSKLAAFIWIVIFLIRISMIVARESNVPTGTALITLILDLVMIFLLLLPSTREWFARREPIIDASTFD